MLQTVWNRDKIGSEIDTSISYVSKIPCVCTVYVCVCTMWYVCTVCVLCVCTVCVCTVCVYHVICVYSGTSLIQLDTIGSNYSVLNSEVSSFQICTVEYTNGSVLNSGVS